MFESYGCTCDGVELGHKRGEVFVGASTLALIHPQDALCSVVLQQCVEAALDSRDAALMLLGEHSPSRLGKGLVMCIATVLLVLLSLQQAVRSSSSEAFKICGHVVGPFFDPTGCQCGEKCIGGVFSDDLP